MKRKERLTKLAKDSPMSGNSVVTTEASHE